MTVAELYCRQYADELTRSLRGAGEDALSGAYEIGRRARAEGLGILDVIAFHHEATLRLLDDGRCTEPVALLRTATSLLSEALSPFEMSYRTVDEANATLRRFNDVLEGEAKRIAHALHDQAGSILASATLELDLTVNHLPPDAQNRLASVRRLLNETGDQLRHLSHELRPTVLDDLGVSPALEFLAEGVARRTGMRIDVRGAPSERLPVDVETALYRIVQEALNNAALHGGESLTVTVSVERRERDVRCVIADDGVGFDVDATLSDRRGLGLRGMRERASAVGAECTINSVPGEGTSIEVVVPLDMPSG